MYGGMYVCISEGTHMCRSHAYVVGMRIWRSEVDFGYLSGVYFLRQATSLNWELVHWANLTS